MSLYRRRVVADRIIKGLSFVATAVVIVGIDGHAAANQVTVQWPSGKTSSTETVPEGTLLTVYENPADSPSGEAFVRAKYRAK